MIVVICSVERHVVVGVDDVSACRQLEAVIGIIVELCKRVMNAGDLNSIGLLDAKHMQVAFDIKIIIKDELAVVDTDLIRSDYSIVICKAVGRQGVADAAADCGIGEDITVIDGRPAVDQLEIAVGIGVVSIDEITVIDKLHSLNNAVLQTVEADIVKVYIADGTVNICPRYEQCSRVGINLNRNIFVDIRHAVKNAALDNDCILFLEPQERFEIAACIGVIHKQFVRRNKFVTVPNAREIGLAMRLETEFRSSVIVGSENEFVVAVVYQDFNAAVEQISLVDDYGIDVGIGIDFDRVDEIDEFSVARSVCNREREVRRVVQI